MSRAFKRIPRALAFVLSAALTLAAGLALQPTTGAKASGNVAALVGELNVGAGDSLHTGLLNSNFIEYRGRLFFWATDGTGYGLWSFDGSSYARAAVAPALANQTLTPPSVHSFAIFNGDLYFSGTFNGETELLVFDGSEVSLAHNFENFPVANLPPSGVSNGGVGYLLSAFGSLYLVANGMTGPPGAEVLVSSAMWRWDGTAMHFVGQTALGTNASNMTRLEAIADKIYFSGSSASGSARPWVYDPSLPWDQTLNTTSNPADLGVIGGNVFVTDFGSIGGKVYFGGSGLAADGVTSVGSEIWVYDPALPIVAAPATAPAVRNPVLVSDLRAGSANSSPTDFALSQGYLFFRASVASGDARIHRIDPQGNLVTLDAVNAGAGIWRLIDFENRLLFGSAVGTDYEVVAYDASVSAPASPFTPLFLSGGTSGFGPLNVYNGEVYWSVNRALVGRELHRFGPAAAPATVDLTPLNLNAPPATPSYSGPIIERVRPNPAFAGEVVEISGLRLAGVSALSIDGQALEITQTDATLITARLPKNLTPGLKDLVVTSNSGLLTVQGALEIAIGALSVTPTFYTKMNLEQGVLKIYARNVVGVGKVQFFANGREIAWVRAADAEDARLNLRSHGMVRSVSLAAMLAGKNSFEIHVDGQRVLRRAHTR